MEYLGFGSVITYNAKEGRFDGAVVGASSDIEFNGKSIAELKRNFEEVVDKFLAKCASKHIDPYRTFKGTIIIRVDSETHREAYLASFREGGGRFLNEWCGMAIRERLARSKTK